MKICSNILKPEAAVSDRYKNGNFFISYKLGNYSFLYFFVISG